MAPFGACTMRVRSARTILSVTAILMVGTVVAGCGRDAEREANAELGQPSAAQANEDSSQQGAEDRPQHGSDLSGLRRPRSVYDELSAAGKHILQDLGPPGVDVSSSRRVLVDRGMSLFLVGAGDGACLVVEDEDGGASQSCYTASNLKTGTGRPMTVFGGCKPPAVTPGPVTGPPVRVEPMCEKLTAFGLVPNGVTEVTVTSQGAPSRAARVTGNAFKVDVPVVGFRAATLEYATADGMVVQQSIAGAP